MTPTPDAEERGSVCGRFVGVTDSRSNVKGLDDQRIDRRSWEDVPKQCLARMLDFPSVQDEYRKTFQAGTPAGTAEQGPAHVLPGPV